ncbi:MAG TPA: homocysteine S-methyltransferase family protein [Ardenticatenaceae bacterium]
MSSILEALAQPGPPILADGAMGTMLQEAGLSVGTAAYTWTASHPDDVLAVHAAYIAVGSHLVLTNTLNAHPPLVSTEEAVALNRAAVALARQSGARWVAGSLGPGAEAAQARALAAAGVDLFWIETQLSLEEALRAVVACQQVGSAPIVVTFSFHRDDGRTHAGETAAKVASTLEQYGVAAIGLNCGNALAGARQRLREMAEACSLPLVIKPNAGLPRRAGDHWVYDLSPDEWANQIVDALVPQVRLVGGCCGTTPAHILALRDRIR